LPGPDSRLGLSLIQDARSGFCVLRGFFVEMVFDFVSGSRFCRGPSIQPAAKLPLGCGQLGRVCSIGPRTIGSTADDIASAATWADRCRDSDPTGSRQRKEQPYWHRVDHPGERLIALKSWLHLVGDLQHPLHSARRSRCWRQPERVVADRFRSASLHHFWNTEWVARLGVSLEVADEEGSLTGRLSLWRGSWTVASVSP
jgi:hypothetical protein